jgi:hypothetical protein
MDGERTAATVVSSWWKEIKESSSHVTFVRNAFHAHGPLLWGNTQYIEHLLYDSAAANHSATRRNASERSGSCHSITIQSCTASGAST